MNAFPARNRWAAELSVMSRVQERAWETGQAFRRPPLLFGALAGP